MSGNRRDTWRPTLELAVQGYLPTKNGRPAEPAMLLPTPTAAGYGSNRSLSPGAAVRPSLATLAPQLGRTQNLPDTSDGGGNRRDASRDADARTRRAGSRPEALLPTPRTSDGRGLAGHGEGGTDLRTAVWQLLPTPRASDGVKGCPAQRGSKGDLTLPSAAVRLDTARVGPVRADAGTGRRAATAPRSRSGPSPEQPAKTASGGLPRELDSSPQAPPAGDADRAWGPYTEAVARWAYLLGRPAPAPTQPGTHGRPVLAPRFVEWPDAGQPVPAAQPHQPRRLPAGEGHPGGAGGIGTPTRPR